MSQIQILNRSAELSPLSNAGSPLLSPSGREQARFSETETEDKEKLSISEMSLGKSLSLAALERPPLLDLSNESLIMDELEKLAQNGFLGIAQGINGREKMAFLLS